MTNLNNSDLVHFLLLFPQLELESRWSPCEILRFYKQLEELVNYCLHLGFPSCAHPSKDARSV